ncbi:MAG: cytochrome c3 family protein [Nitrospirota bacterium]
MARALIFTVLLFIAALPYTMDAAGAKGPSDACNACHVFSYRYIHGAIRDCSLCHPETPSKREAARIIDPESSAAAQSHSFQKNAIAYLCPSLEDREYQMEIVLTDREGRASSPQAIPLIPAYIGEHRAPTLTEISGVTVEEIKKGILVEATISWTTDAPATTEIEYGLSNDRMSVQTLDALFTREHRAVLSGLKHKKQYRYRVVSRDIYGNSITSPEYTFDTAEGLSPRKEPRAGKEGAPALESAKVVSISGQKGLYLMLSANKPAAFRAEIRGFRQKALKHGVSAAPERYATIDVCIGCHKQDESHPVGVRADSRKTRIPQHLPTIEGGVITCVSCHDPHGGERKFFARLEFNKKLCDECHIYGL